MNSLETTLSSGRELCPRGKRSGEQSQSVDKPDRRMGRRPRAENSRSCNQKGLKAGQYQRKIPGLVGSLPWGTNRQNISGW